MVDVMKVRYRDLSVSDPKIKKELLNAVDRMWNKIRNWCW